MASFWEVDSMRAPRADISDGLLDMVIMKNSGSFKILDKLVEIKGESQVH